MSFYPSEYEGNVWILCRCLAEIITGIASVVMICSSFIKTKQFSAACLLMVASALPALAQVETTGFQGAYFSNFDGVSPIINPLRDHLGGTLTGGLSEINGDGAVFQYGYFTSTTPLASFTASDWDSFVPITSADLPGGGMTRYTTTIGDTNSGAPPGFDLGGS